MTKTKVLEALTQEVDWRKNTKRTMPDEYCEGFIAGLKHSKKYIKSIPWQ